MIPKYEYIITGFLFGSIVTIDIMMIVYIISRPKPKRKKAEIYNDLPRIYRKEKK